MLSASVKIQKRDIGMSKLLKTIKDSNHAFVKVGLPSGGNVSSPEREGSGHKPFSSISELNSSTLRAGDLALSSTQYGLELIALRRSVFLTARTDLV